MTTLRLLPLLLLAGCSQYRVQPVATELLQPQVRFADLQPRELEVQFYSGMLLLEAGDALRCDLKIDVTADSLAELARLRNQIAPALREENGRTCLSVALPSGTALEALQTVYALTVPAQTRVVAITREGAVTVRGFRGNVEVRGGSGEVDVELDGGSARLQTGSGRVQLRGLYRNASVRTGSGRIDLVTPPPGLALDVELHSRSGELFVDLQGGQNLDVFYRGEIERVRSDPEVRVLWHEVREQGDAELHVGTFGEPSAPVDGRLAIDSDATVNVRLAPMARPAGS